MNKIWLFAMLLSVVPVLGQTQRGVTFDPASNVVAQSNLVMITPAFRGGNTKVTPVVVERALEAILSELKNPLDYGAAGTGLVDDSAFLSNALKAAVGKTVWLPPGRTFLVKNVPILDGTTLEGNGSKLLLPVLASQEGSPHLVVLGTNVTIRNIVFDGQRNLQPSNLYCDCFASTTPISGRAFRSAILADGGTNRLDGTSNKVDGLTITGCRFERIFGTAIATRNLNRVIVNYNTITNSNFELFFVDKLLPGGAVYDTNTVYNRDFTLIGNRGYNCGTGAGPGGVTADFTSFVATDGIQFRENYAEGFERDLIKLNGCRNANVVNNEFRSNIESYVAVQVDAQSPGMQNRDNLIQGNKFHNLHLGISVQGYEAYRIRVLDNVIDGISDLVGPTPDGIQVGGGNGTNISDIAIKGNVLRGIQRMGIGVAKGNNLDISDNIIVGAGTVFPILSVGIYIAPTVSINNVRIVNNTVSNFNMSASSVGQIAFGQGVAGVTLTDLFLTGNKVDTTSPLFRGIRSAGSDWITGTASYNSVNGIMELLQKDVVRTFNIVTGAELNSSGSSFLSYRTNQLYVPPVLAIRTLPTGLPGLVLTNQKVGINTLPTTAALEINTLANDNLVAPALSFMPGPGAGAAGYSINFYGNVLGTKAGEFGQVLVPDSSPSSIDFYWKTFLSGPGLQENLRLTGGGELQIKSQQTTTAAKYLYAGTNKLAVFDANHNLVSGTLSEADISVGTTTFNTNQFGNDATGAKTIPPGAKLTNMVLQGSTLVTAENSNTPRSLESRLAEVYNPRDYGAVGNGVADDTLAFNALLSVVPPGAIIELNRGVYRISSTLTLTKTNLTLMGPGEIMATTRFAMLFITNATKIKGVTFNPPVVDANNPPYILYSNGDDVNDIVIRECNFGRGLIRLFDADISDGLAKNSNVSVEDCYFFGDYQGWIDTDTCNVIDLRGYAGVSVSRNRFFCNNPERLISVGGGPRSVIVNDNLVRSFSAPTNAFGAKQAFQIGFVDGRKLSMVGNNITLAGSWSVALEAKSGFSAQPPPVSSSITEVIIGDNNIDMATSRTPANAVDFYGPWGLTNLTTSAGITFSGNVIRYQATNSTDGAVMIAGYSAAAITGNTITWLTAVNSGKGLEMGNCESTTISGNVIKNSSLRVGGGLNTPGGLPYTNSPLQLVITGNTIDNYIGLAGIFLPNIASASSIIINGNTIKAAPGGVTTAMIWLLNTVATNVTVVNNSGVSDTGNYYKSGTTSVLNERVAFNSWQPVTAITPLDFGATVAPGDDDTVAFQAAMNAATLAGQPVTVPTGSYRVSTLTVTAPIQGSGLGSVIEPTISLALVANNVGLRDLRVNSFSHYAIHSTNTLLTNLWLDNVTITFDPSVINIRQEQYKWLSPLAFASEFTEGLRIQNCHAYRCGFQLNRASNLIFTGNYLDGGYNNWNELLHSSANSRTIVAENVFLNSFADPLDMYSSGSGCRVVNNIFDGWGDPTITSTTSDDRPIGVNEAVITMKVIFTDNANSSGPLLGFTENTVISGNTFRNGRPTANSTRAFGIMLKTEDLRTNAVPAWNPANSSKNVLVVNNIFDGWWTNNLGNFTNIFFAGVHADGTGIDISHNIFRDISQQGNGGSASSQGGVELGFYLGTTNGTACIGCTVSHNLYEGEGTGIIVYNTTNSVIEANIVQEDPVTGLKPRYGMIINGNMAQSVIRGNIFNPTFAVPGGILLLQMPSTGGTNYVVDCLFDGNITASGIPRAWFFPRSYNNTFVNNMMGPVIIGTDNDIQNGNVFRGNSVYGQVSTPGLDMKSQRNFQISDNRFTNCIRAINLSGGTATTDTEVGIISANLSTGENGSFIDVGTMSATSLAKIIRYNNFANNSLKPSGGVVNLGGNVNVGSLISAGFIQIPNNSAYGWANGTLLSSSLDGTLNMLNGAGNNFSVLNWGGNTINDMGLTRTVTGLHLKSGNSSHYTNFFAANATLAALAGNTGREVGLDALGKLVLAPAREIMFSLSDPTVALAAPRTNYISLPNACTITAVRGRLLVPGTSTTTLTLRNGGGATPITTISLASGATNAVGTLTGTSIAADAALVGEVTTAGSGSFGGLLVISYTVP